MLSFQQFIVEDLKKGDLPGIPKPGETPIPHDHIRLYHQTRADQLDQIKREGIKHDSARGIEGPKAVWAHPTGFYGKPGDIPSAEFSIPKHEWDGTGMIHRSIKPSEILAVHHRWHGHARYIAGEPEAIAATKRGEYDDMNSDPDYKPALDHIKAHH